MKFLKALGIGIATQLSVTILSVILLLAFCSVSPGGASVILSGVVALGAYIGFYFKFKKPNVGKAFYWLSFAFIRLLYIPLLWFWDIFIAKKMWQRLCRKAHGFPHSTICPLSL